MNQRPVNSLLINLLIAIRPLLGFASCKFPMSCTTFALAQLRDLPLVPACRSIARQVLACNPFW
ncbi:MAG: hypothetical protein BWY54_00271 [Candidatus Dependentiae bacterium ADurb.Bin331]|nr:MAG: hypothetical protein BWY54_00271 [Candidatus Dependentiae bacterium ADurb.Bin331]